MAPPPPVLACLSASSHPDFLALPPSQRIRRPPGTCTPCVALSVSAVVPAQAAVLLTNHPPTLGGWALNMKDLKLLQTIGKGEFGGERGALGTLGGPEGPWGVLETTPALFPQM